ncbi:MAG TPA: PAS domain S-box protein [Noviherbaspirillum sp.]
MDGSVPGRIARIVEWLSPVLSALVMLTGVLVMLGWAFQIKVFTSVLPELGPMKFNTAFLLFLAGAGLCCASLPRPSHVALTRFASACAGIVLLAGALTALEYLSGLNLGIDELLVREPDAMPGESPGRMSLAAAFNFTFCGMAILLFVRDARRYAEVIHVAATLIILTAVAMFLAYVYDTEALHRERLTYTPTALNTTLAFMMLATALLNADPAYPFRCVMTDEGVQGSTARRLLPVALLLPLLGGGAVMQVHGSGFAGHLFATSTFAAATLMGFAGMVLWNAVQMGKAEKERQRMEQELRSASQYARSLLEASLDPLVTISVEGRITDVNRATEQVTGRGRNELVGSDFTDYFTSPEQARTGYRKVLEQGLLRDYPLTIRHRSGRTEDVLYNATTYCDASGKVQGVFAAARVVTELKRTEQALSQLAAIVRSSGDGIMGIDLDGIIRSWNTGAEQIYGYTATEILNTPVSLLAPPEDRAEMETLLQQTRAGNMVINHDVMRIRKDGRAIHVALTLSPIRDEHGDITGVSIIARDISEKKRAEQELQRYKDHLEEEVAARTEQLQAANKELESFSYSVSHDLRVPLRAIDGYSRMVLDLYSASLDDEGKRLLRVIRENVERMGVLIDDILAFSRMGRAAMSRAEVDMRALAQDVIDELKPTATGRAIRFVVGDLPPATGDRNLLRQVLTNLLANAIKFTRPRPQATIEIDGDIKGDQCIYSIMDNGVGFDMQYADRLFGVFQRLHGIDEFEGTGIGLAIVKRIVERHGGRVWAEGVVDRGATFRFALPRKEDNDDRPEP